MKKLWKRIRAGSLSALLAGGTVAAIFNTIFLPTIFGLHGFPIDVPQAVLAASWSLTMLAFFGTLVWLTPISMLFDRSEKEKPSRLGGFARDLILVLPVLLLGLIGFVDSSGQIEPLIVTGAGVFAVLGGNRVFQLAHDYFRGRKRQEEAGTGDSSMGYAVEFDSALKAEMSATE